jgi:hypothetical protein
MIGPISVAHRARCATESLIYVAHRARVRHIMSSFCGARGCVHHRVKPIIGGGSDLISVAHVTVVRHKSMLFQWRTLSGVPMISVAHKIYVRHKTTSHV